ncbi:MAG: thiamine phosphate synthase [Lachnospiraceae bacterium]|nr:thiamine phosphate synthase [Lachnospiraceae bacterium]
MENKFILQSEKYSDIKIIAITDRLRCERDFLEQIRIVAKAAPRTIILREKDLSEEEYFKLAYNVNEICKSEGVDLTIHTFTNVAKKLGIKKIHLPLGILKDIKQSELSEFEEIGASTHSISEAEAAKKLGATYITAGHIFETDCKKGLKGRGLVFLKEMIEATNLPVYAIGGINSKNVEEVLKIEPYGICVMGETNKIK